MIGQIGFLPIDFDNFLSFGCEDEVRLRDHFFGCGFLMDVLLRVDSDFGFDIGVGKKLLRLFASVSAFAVIVPVNFFCHGIS